MPARTFTKDPDATLDYGRDWTPWLAGVEDTLASSEWSVSPAGELQTSNPSHNATVTKVWLSGGVVGKSYRVTNRVTTTGGRIDERSFTVAVLDR